MKGIVLFLLIIAVLFIVGCQSIPFADSPGPNWRLSEAAGAGNIKSVEKLVQEGADVNSAPKIMEENTGEHGAILMSAAYGWGNNDSETERLEVVKYLLNHGANPWLASDDGKNAVDCAYYSKSLKIAAYLKEYMKAHPKEYYPQEKK